jgi:hypothetical protein
MKQKLQFHLNRWLRIAMSLWLLAPEGVLSPAPVFADIPSDSFTLTVRPLDQFPPAPITDLAALAGSTEGQVTLAWTAPHEDDVASPSGNPAASYQVRYSTYSADSVASTTTWWNQAGPINGAPAPALPGTSELFLVPTYLEPGATLYFAIRSMDDSAPTNTSDVDVKAYTAGQQAFAVVFDSAPATPQNLSGSQGSGQVNLSWDAVSAQDLDYYLIQRSTTSFSTTPFDIIVDSGTLSTIDAGLTDGTTYSYRIQAVDKGGPSFLGNALASLPSANIDVVPGASGAPNAPSLAADAGGTTATQIRWVLTDNANNETGLYVYRTSPFPGTRVSGNLAFGSPVTGGTTGYIETGLTPNTPYMRVGEAYNVSGSSFSAEITAYTMANPPVNSRAAAVSTHSITVEWDANGNPGYTDYEVEYAQNAAFTNAVGAGSTENLTMTLFNLDANTNYWIRVRARNEANSFTSYDVSVATRTEKSKDVTPPKAPAGVWAEWLKLSPTEGQMRLHWRNVTENEDGTPFDDAAAEPYKVYRSDTLQMDTLTPWPKVWSAPTPAQGQGDGFGPSTEDMLETNKIYYYRVRAIDAAGNESPDSMIVQAKGDGSELNVLATGSNMRSRVAIPVEVARGTLLRETNGLDEDVVVKATEILEEEQGRVVTSVQFDAFRTSDGSVVKNFVIRPALGTVMVGYEVANGQVIQGNPALKAAGAPTPASGAPMLDASKANQQLALFWFNGVEWVKVGGTVDTTNQVVQLRTGRLGRYQVRQALRVGPASLTRVYPQIFTPNGDGWNDKVVFEFDNPALMPLKGEIFDVSGAKVADLVAGPNIDTSLEWDGKKSGTAVPGGVYIYQIEVGGDTVNGTVVVAK